MSEGHDPSGYITSPPSTVVKVIGTPRNDLNGMLGIAVSYNSERQRYLVHITESQSTMALRSENLMKANMLESYKCQYQQLGNDPRVKEKLGHYLAVCRAYVHPWDLFNVLWGIALLWLLLFVRHGLIKTIMTTCVIMILIMIISPDLIAKAPAKTILENFPKRSKETVCF